MGDMVRQWAVVPVHQATYQGPGQLPNLQNAIFLSIYHPPFSPSRFPLPHRLYPSFLSLPQMPPRSLVAAPKTCSQKVQQYRFFSKKLHRHATPTDIVDAMSVHFFGWKSPRGAQW